MARSRLLLSIALLAVVLLAMVLLAGCSRSTPGPDAAANAAYLEKAAAEPGAVKTSTGLIFKELRPGTGAGPRATSKVKVHYRGTLVDGTEFDSSYKRGQPAEFGLDQVVPCWTEGVQRIRPGGKAQLVCPSKIAYGDAGSPPTIPPGATLVFEIELLEITAI